jgi:glycerol-3-phosphate dehydrogenase (NAD(P)+)
MTKAVQLFPTVVIGAGAWGTALAIAIARNGHDVVLWGRDEQHLAAMRADKANTRYLPGITFPDTLSIADSFEDAVGAANHILLSVPSTAFSSMLEAIKPLISSGVPLSWATKGLTPETGEFLHDTALSILGESHPLAIITGPSFAAEVAKGLPTAVTVASHDSHFNLALASALHGS